MNKLHKINLLILLLLVAGYALGNTIPDSTHSFNSFKLYKLQNQWLQTGNIARISLNPDKNIGFVQSGYRYDDGSYHRMREAETKNEFFLESESIQKIKEMYFYGKFAYSNSDEKGILWNGVFDPYRGNPYIIGDSVPGANYHKEIYQLSGGMAKKFNNKLTLGLLVDYMVGIGAKQKDPRPENVVMNISVNPSVILKMDNFILGFDAGYRNRKEEIDYTQIATDNPDPTFFTFKGFGFHNYEVDYGVDRFQTEKAYFGGFQFQKEFGSIQSLTELRGEYSSEEIDDGSSVIKKEDGGDWKVISIDFNQQLKLQTGQKIHSLSFHGNFTNGQGTEYTQEIVFDEDRHANYITISKNLKFERLAMNALLNYNFVSLSGYNKVNWDIEGTAGLTINDEKYNYIPEIFTADYMNLNTGIKVQKNFYKKALHFAPQIEVNYLQNLSNSMSLSNDPGITKKQNKELYMFDHNFYIADLIAVKAGLNVGFNMPNSKTIEQLNLNINYSYSQTNDQLLERNFLSGKIGIMF